MKKQYKPVPDIECLKYHGTPEKPDIKIFVSHRIDLDSETIDNPLYIPVRCGAVYDEREGVTMLGDDTGDNISEKRNSFCELTVLYWAWKNVKADYYGLCHYRRYLSFADTQFKTNKNVYAWGCVPHDYVDDGFVEKFQLSAEKMADEVKKFDLLISEPVDMSATDGTWKSNRDYMEHHKREYEIEDVNLLIKIIHEISPEFDQYTENYFSSAYGQLYNCFIMKKNLFFDFCEWLFKILGEFEKRIDAAGYCLQKTREPAFFAEPLWGIYLQYLESISDCKISRKQTAFINDPLAYPQNLKPAFENNILQTIPVIFSCSDSFAPICAVAIQSIIEHSVSRNYYDIVIMENSISEENKAVITGMISDYPNFSIRFFRVNLYIRNYRFEVDRHVTAETFYRFLIPDMLPNYDKAIYLDVDLVCNRDIADLYRLDVSDYLLAAAHDPDVTGLINKPNSDVGDYLRKDLQMKNPYGYFQAGVLVINTRKFREMYTVNDWLRMTNKLYRYWDQDILNQYCEGKILYFDMSWNVLNDCRGYRASLISNWAPCSIANEYQKARNHPYVVHYAGYPKPWNQPFVDYEQYFWRYARQTPFYEVILYRMMQRPSPSAPYQSRARNLADRLMPKGSRRRELAKKILPKGSKRWNFCKKIYYKIFRH